MTALLDVNVLIALVWPNHVGHQAARTWFAEASAAGWATTPMTESGFVRVSSNRRALPRATTPAIAVEMLGRLRSLPGHAFWPDGVELVTGRSEVVLTGHQQVTDAHLLALCRANGGQFVTFDRAVSAWGDDDEVVLLAP
ncbi:TA system VapC family ribonuclease toxin [Nocardioides sp. AE5]|uniref:TA system VapC family ribonuclease toxin n=1 Tax=Nocardioides sp. AE5 TaxID=2962573 RepID=UPI0028818839|nr:TA system VapC family ribonuclease toxin [Nocardioides sp. AE5]MDT0200362.1 PIN domain-containing protein [Nocardioides sp. AE5]